MPPSLGGSSRGRSTVKPRSSSSRTVVAEQQRVAEHPAAESHHVEPVGRALPVRQVRRPARPRPRGTSRPRGPGPGPRARRPRRPGSRARRRPPAARTSRRRRTGTARRRRRTTGRGTRARSPPRPRSRRRAARRGARRPRRRAGPCWRSARSRGRSPAGARARPAPGPGRRRPAGRSSVPLHARGPEVGERHPVGPRDAGVAAGERDVAEVRDAAEGLVVADQHLAAPDRPVRAVAGAVEGEADHLVVGAEAVLAHHRGDVRVVVLDRAHLAAVGVQPGPRRRAVAGVRVRDQQAGPDAGELLEVAFGDGRAPPGWRGRPCPRCAG